MHSMLILVLLILVIGDLVIQLDNADVLAARIADQRDALQESRRVRTQLEAIAGDTALLAEAGNPNAVIIRQALNKQGITISPPER